MNHSSVNSHAINDSARCQHRTTFGKRCRLRVIDPRSGLCFRHSSKQSELPHAADLRSILAGELTQFECAHDVNKFFSNLFSFSQKIVSPRVAAPSWPTPATSSSALSPYAFRSCKPTPTTNPPESTL